MNFHPAEHNVALWWSYIQDGSSDRIARLIQCCTLGPGDRATISWSPQVMVHILGIAIVTSPSPMIEELQVLSLTLGCEEFLAKPVPAIVLTTNMPQGMGMTDPSLINRITLERNSNVDSDT